MKNFRAARRNTTSVVKSDNKKTVYPTFPEPEKLIPVSPVESVTPTGPSEPLKLVPAKTYSFDKTKFKGILAVLVVAASAYFGSDYVQEILSFIPGYTDNKVLTERLTKLEGEFVTLTESIEPVNGRLDKLEVSLSEIVKHESDLIVKIDDLSRRVVKLESNNPALLAPEDHEKIKELLNNTDSKLEAGVIKSSN